MTFKIEKKSRTKLVKKTILHQLFFLFMLLLIKHDVINAMKRPSDQQPHQLTLDPTLKKQKITPQQATIINFLPYQHRQNNYPYNSMIIRIGEGPYSCNRCKIIFHSLYTLQDHSNFSLCSFHSNFSLYSPQVNEKTHKKKPYGCNLCDKAYFHKNNLAVHLKTNHPKNNYPHMALPVLTYYLVQSLTSSDVETNDMREWIKLPQ